jgi:hypothetical protein
MTNAANPDFSIPCEAMLKHCMAKGMQPPFHMVAVGSNGTCVFGQFTRTAEQDALSFTSLSVYSADGRIRAPINVMMVDAKGAVSHGAVVKA